MWKLLVILVVKITIDLLYFWDTYDVNLWKKLAITVKLCFIETRLKKDWFVRLLFENKRNNKSFNNRGYSLLILMNIFYKKSFRVFCEKGVLKVSQNLQQNTYACSLQLYLKWLLQVFEFSETFQDTLLNRTPPMVAFGLFF